MAIDIRNVTSNKVATGSTQSKRVKSRDNAVTESAEETSEDSVELTGTASKITSLIQQMMTQPAVDRSRVDPVKEKIAENKYHVEADQIAGRMLDFESSLNRAR